MAVDVTESFSPFWRNSFLVYLRRYFAKNFHGVRVSLQGPAPDAGERPLIVYANHPSWWDPIHFVLMASKVLPERHVFGPMEAEMLSRYAFFKRLGAFGIDRSPEAPRMFLETALEILSRPEASLWLTAEGRFTDPRSRPVKLRPGLAMLARRLQSKPLQKPAIIQPLAVEYPFWDERRPEALTRFGAPIDLAQEPRRSVRDWTAFFARRLETALDGLAEDAASRDIRRFVTLLAGNDGADSVYDRWRRVLMRLRGRPRQATRPALAEFIHGEKRS